MENKINIGEYIWDDMCNGLAKIYPSIEREYSDQLLDLTNMYIFALFIDPDSEDSYVHGKALEKLIKRINRVYKLKVKDVTNNYQKLNTLVAAIVAKANLLHSQIVAFNHLGTQLIHGGVHVTKH